MLYSLCQVVFGFLLFSFVKTDTAPTITNNGTKYLIHNGGDAIIYCETLGNPRPSTSWQINGNELTDKNLFSTNGFQNFIVSKNASLVIRNQLKSDRYGLVNVTCVANNTAGRAQRTFQVVFFKAPRILTNSSKILVIDNSLAVLYIGCETSTGYPEPTLVWSFDGHVLNSSQGYVDGGNIHHGSKPVADKISYYIFSNGTLQLDGLFTVLHFPYHNLTCAACNIAGNDSKTFGFHIEKLESYTFYVVIPPMLTPGIEENVRMQIRAAFPSGKLFHSLNITSIDMINGIVTFELTWKKKDLDKAGYGVPRDVGKLAGDVYRAIEYGKLKPIKLRMNVPPGPPVDLSVKDIQAESVTVTWKHPQFFDVDLYHVQMTKNSCMEWRNVTSVDNSVNGVVLEKLEPSTMYNVTLQSENKYGLGLRKSDILRIETKSKNKVNDGAGSPVTIIVVVVIVVIVLFGLALGLSCYWRRNRKLLQDDRKFVVPRENPYEDSIPGVSPDKIYVRDEKTYCPMGYCVDSDEQEYFSWNEISRNSLTKGKILGQGEFGLVFKAMWNDKETNLNIPVAVKTVKDSAAETDRKELLKELRLMADVAEHPNIVNLVGACSKGGPLLVIVEFCVHGNLLNYLEKNRKDVTGMDCAFVTSLVPLTRIKFAYDVSQGMSYLEEKKIVHRDLAARNVLLGENKIAKVSDFGLSRDIYERGLYQKTTEGRLPVKWMAIESLAEAKYTSKSDVWSFGVLLWEIETGGMLPYPGLAGNLILEYLQRGNRLGRPLETSFELYELMNSCWQPNPTSRPRFQDLRSTLEKFVEKHSEYLPVLFHDQDSNSKPDAEYINYKPGEVTDKTMSTGV